MWQVFFVSQSIVTLLSEHWIFSLSLSCRIFYPILFFFLSVFLLYKRRHIYTKARLIILIDVITSSSPLSLCRRIASSLCIAGTAHYCRYYQENSSQTNRLPIYSFLFGSSSFFLANATDIKKPTEPSTYLYLYIYLL